GTISATEQARIHSSKIIENTGKIETKQGDIALRSQKNIEQKGSIVARQGGISLQAKERIAQSGETVSKGNVGYQAQNILISKNALIAAGAHAVQQNGYDALILDPSASQGSHLTLSSKEKLVTQGKNIASGKLVAEGNEVTLDHAQTLGYDVTLLSKQTDLNVNQANIYATNTLELSTKKWLSTQGSQLSADTITATQRDLNNQGGTWVQRGIKDFVLQTTKLNNQAGAISSQGNFMIHAYNVNNQQGKLVSLGEQHIHTDNFLNTEGKIVSGNHQSIQLVQLANDKGVISSQAAQHIQVQQHIDNRQGRISAVNSQINVGSLDNSEQGLLAASRHLDIRADTGVNNAKGMINSADVSVNTKVLNNKAGILYGNDSTHLQIAKTIDNQNNGKIISLGKASLQAERLDNRAGVVQVAGQLNLTVQQIQNNKVSDEGSFIQADQLTIKTDHLNNQGTFNSSIQTLRQGVSANEITINTQSVDNTEGGIYAQKQANLNVEKSLNNQKGKLLSWGDISIAGKDLSINNDGGHIQAVDMLDIHARSVLKTGHLEADKLRLTLKSDFTTQQDINAKTEFKINTTGNIVNNYKLSAGEHLTLNAQQIDNQEKGRLSSAETRITATGKITNRGLINSFSDEDNSKTVVKAGHIDNVGWGRIYGDQVALQANKIENRDERNKAGEVKSATIAARQRLDLAGQEMINDTSFYESDKKGGSTIYSGGQIEFGAHLNEDDQAEGKAGILRNKSSIIEAEGGIALNHIEKTFNTNEHFETEVMEIPEEGNKNHIEYVMIGTNGLDFNTGGLVKNDRFWHRRTPGKNKPGVYDLVWKTTLDRKLENDELEAGYIPLANQKSCSSSDPSLCYINPTTVYGSDYGIWKRFNLNAPKDAPSLASLPTVRPEPVKPRKPRRLSNAVRKAKYEEAMRRYEAEMAAYKQDIDNYNEAIKGYDSWVKNNAEVFAELNNRIKANNDSLPDHYRDRWTMQVKEEKVLKSQVTKSLPGQILAGGDIDLGESYLENDRSTLISGGLIHKEEGILNNLDEKGVEFHQLYGMAKWVHPRWRGRRKGWRWYGDNYNDVIKRRETKTSFDMNIFTALSHTDKASVKNPFYVDQVSHLEKQDNDVALTPLNRLTVQGANKPNVLENIESQLNNKVEIRTTQPDTRLPTQSLYKVNPAAESHVLIETDPEFINKNRWLSSDYMFKALRNDPQNMMKRLGDGYYEQRLVREQMNRLTGRHFSGDNRTFEAQYKALMDAGVTFAKKFNLAVGVSLTPTQVAQLTSDIVWIEKQTVTLPSGKQVEALIPRVYVVVKKGDLDGAGTLISGEKIYVNGSDFENQGTIAGHTFNKIETESLKNSGKLTGGVLSARVSGNLDNIGGVLEADKAMILNIGNDFNHQSTTQQSDIQAYGLNRLETNLDRKALLHVKDEEGVLSVSANNIMLNGAAVRNDGKGLTLLDAKNKLNLIALSVGYDEKLGKSSSYRNAALQDVVVSSVKGKGDVQLQAKAIETQGGELEAQQRLMLIAENDLVLGAAKKTASLEQYHKTKSRNVVSSRSSEVYSYDKLNAHDVTALQGKHIELNAGGNAFFQGTQAVAAQDIHTVAGGALEVGTVTNSHEQIKWEKHKKSGLAASVSGSTAQLGYQRTKSASEGKGYSEVLIGSNLTAQQGKLSLEANQNVNINASRLASGGDMTIGGKNVHLNAVNEIHHSEQHQKQKTSGVGIGVVYNPLKLAQENYRQKEEQGGTKTFVGKWMSASEAIGDAAESLGRGVMPYARHSRSESHQHTQKSEAKTTALEAGGKLVIQAKEGDIRTQGSRISAEGDAAFIAKNNITFDVVTHHQGQQAHSQSKTFSADGLNKYVAGMAMQKEKGDSALTQEVGTTVSIGGNSTTIAEKGDITLKGTTFVANGTNHLQATEGNVNLLTAETRESSRQARKGHGIGEAVISDTERFWGYNRTRMNQAGEQVNHQGSRVASLNNSVSVYAGQDYTQTASEILAKERVDISAQNITLNNALNHQENSQSESDLKIGQFSRVKSPIIDLLNTIESAVKNDSASERLK
ncbi:hemagglutinin repeat-containing protein, partial [Rodentibacter heidelbergensis]|uniref:hemagglutinin repeat-containing protein n=1 Tax=Rodentibacter heidelbergensis TaxID=1908258 RepID=UPI001ABF8E4F